MNFLKQKQLLIFLAGILCVLMFMESRGQAAEQPITFLGTPGDPLPEGWTTAGTESTSEIVSDGDGKDKILFRLSIPESAGHQSGQLVHSPKVPIVEDALVKLDYTWSAEGVYDDPENIQKTYARVEVFFISHDNEYISGMTNWYFEPSEIKHAEIEVKAPAGAARFAVRIGLTRIGDSLGAPGVFTIGNFNLVVTEPDNQQ